MIEPHEWQTETNFVLSVGELHVWRVFLNVSSETLAACRQFLSAEEKARADRFHFEKHRVRFTIARGSLRAILGRYTGVPPAHVAFEYSEFGKPILHDQESAIRFNLSHSGDLMVAVFASGMELGVDIEKDNRRVNALDISKRFFSAGEHEAIARQTGGDRLQMFLSYWTAKEAIMKGTGLGLRLEPKAIEIELDPLRIVSLPPEIDRPWELHSFKPAPGFTGAVAASAVLHRRSYFEWPAATA